MRETFILEDASGNELSKIQEKKLTVRDKMTIERGSTTATVRKRLLGIRDHYIIEVEGGEDLKAHGNIVDHEYEIERDGDTVATVSKKWFRVRDTYGVQWCEARHEAAVDVTAAGMAARAKVPATTYISWVALALMTTSSVASLRPAPTMAVYGLACDLPLPRAGDRVPAADRRWSRRSSPRAGRAASTTGWPGHLASRWASSPSGASSR